MSTKIFKIGIVLMLLASVFSGCKKYLDTEPRGVIQQSDFYKTDADAKAAVMACYNMLQVLNSTAWSSMWYTKVLLGDDLYTGGGSRGDQSGFEEINEFRFGATNPMISSIFQQSYFGIYRANKVIDNVLPENAVKKAILAEAKTLRAYYYFDLVSLWGKVPLVLHELKPSEYSQPGAEPAAIWAQIEKDLTEAVPDLPLKSAQSATDKGRVSKGAAQSLLGKAYLYQNKNAEAATQFKNVISSNEYSLVPVSSTIKVSDPDYSKIFRTSTEFGAESIFELAYSNDKGADWGTFNWSNGARNNSNNIILQLCGPRGDGWFEYKKAGADVVRAGWGFGYPRKSLYDAFVAAGDKVRLAGTLMDEATLVADGGKMRNADKGNTLPVYCEGFVRLKYGSWAGETSSSGVGELNYGTNLRLIRYADVLLMAAEACKQSGDQANADTYFNLIRTRANLATKSAISLDDIIAERQLELAFEGHRFQDLIRWKKAASTLATQGQKYPNGDGTYSTVSDAGFKTGKNELLPIPEQEITVNKNMSQNAGY